MKDRIEKVLQDNVFVIFNLDIEVRNVEDNGFLEKAPLLVLKRIYGIQGHMVWQVCIDRRRNVDLNLVFVVGDKRII